MLKNIIWLSGATVDGTFYRYVDLIPKSMIKRINNHEMIVEFRNGSILRFINTNDKVRLRGMTPTGVIISEYAYNKSDVLETINPAVLRNKAWLIVNSTAISLYDHFWKLLTKPPKGWFVLHENAHSLIDENGQRYVTDDEIQRAIDAGMSKSAVAADYMCHPIPDVERTIFGNEMSEDIKIQSDLFNCRLPVHIVMDIGLNDYTSILLFQFSMDKKITIIGEYERNNEPTIHYANAIKQCCKNKRIGKIYLPHDGAKRNPMCPSLSTYVDFYTNEGFTVYKLKRPSPLEAAIQLAKTYCGNIAIDESCTGIITALSEWSRDENRKPIHDDFSHYAMAFVYLCMALYYDLDYYRDNITVRRYSA